MINALCCLQNRNYYINDLFKLWKFMFKSCLTWVFLVKEGYKYKKEVTDTTSTPRTIWPNTVVMATLTAWASHGARWIKSSLRIQNASWPFNKRKRDSRKCSDIVTILSSDGGLNSPTMKTSTSLQWSQSKVNYRHAFRPLIQQVYRVCL